MLVHKEYVKNGLDTQNLEQLRLFSKRAAEHNKMDAAKALTDKRRQTALVASYRWECRADQLQAMIETSHG